MPVPKNWSESLTDEISSMLKSGQEVNLNGIGRLIPTKQEARTARNPATGATVQVPAKTVAKFSVSSTLKGALNAA